MLLEKWKINEMNSKTVLVYCFERIPRLLLFSKAKSIGLHNRDLADILVKLKKPEFSRHKVPLRRQLHRDFQRSSEELLWVFTWDLIGTCLEGNYLRPGKEPHKKIRKNNLRSSQGRSSSCSQLSESKKKFIIRGASIRVLKRFMPQ